MQYLRSAALVVLLVGDAGAGLDDGVVLLCEAHHVDPE